MVFIFGVAHNEKSDTGSEALDEMLDRKMGFRCEKARVMFIVCDLYFFKVQHVSHYSQASSIQTL